jgi:DNA-binding CsgD family transcriptional regulator/PAS domain-containing protein
MAKVPTARLEGMAYLRGPSPQQAPSNGDGPGLPPFTRARPARSPGLSPERCANILSTLQEISMATADVEGCSRLLECISDELQAEQGVLILCNPLTRRLEFVVHNQDPAFPKLYADYYWTLDPTGLPEFLKGNRSLPAHTPVSAVFDLRDVVDYSSWVSTEFYNDFWKTGGIYHDLVAFMSATPLARGALCLHRAHERTPFSAEEAAIMDMIAPFVGNHLEKMVSATVLSALQTAEDKGVIVCDAHGRVLYCNDIARDLCSPLGQTDGDSRPLSELSSDAQVASFVGYALNSADALAESCSVRVSSREVTLGQGTSGRLITLEPRDKGARGWNEPLKERFALSDREIEVLNRVMAGGTNREISQALFIAECTVKKHMQSIAAKVGARTRTSIAHAVRQELGLTP